MAWAATENRYGDDKVYDACGLIGFIDTSGGLHGGASIVAALDSMKERGNGLGAGFAAYGIYPELANHYALHVMCRSEAHRQELDGYLRRYFAVAHDEPIPHRNVAEILDPPLVWRYFCAPQSAQMGGRSEEDFVVHHVMRINSTMDGAFVFSSGKDMGVFKGVGHPDEIAEFFCIDAYRGYMWTAHNRFPTNTPGWWGGAHPFGLLDWTVVHNGEISSYGINRRYMEARGYLCTMQTDTEVIAYAADLLMRRHGLPARYAAQVFAAPLWEEIAILPPAEQRTATLLRQTYGSLLLNGPFTIILARNGEMMGLGDRVRLRPLSGGVKGDVLFVSSELAAIHLVEPELEHNWTPVGGDAIIGRLGVKPAIPAEVLQSEAQDLKEFSYA